MKHFLQNGRMAVPGWNTGLWSVGVRVALVIAVAHGSFSRAWAREELLRFEGIRVDRPLLAALDVKPEWNAASLDQAWERRDVIDLPLVEFVQRDIAPKYESISDYELLFRACRLAYYVGNYLIPSDRSEQKIKIFELAMAVGEKARKVSPQRVEGHYWTALAMGMWGLQRGILTSLGKANDMKNAVDAAINLDPTYEQAGPLRVRGRLFFKLPGGLISFGDNQKALADLQKAIELGPEHPLNFAYLAEVQAKTKGKDTALKTLQTAKMLNGVTLGQREAALAKKEVAELEFKLK